MCPFCLILVLAASLFKSMFGVLKVNNISLSRIIKNANFPCFIPSELQHIYLNKP